MSAVADAPLASLTVNGIRIETVDKGRGRPLLFLHAGIGLEPPAPVLARVAERRPVTSPHRPKLKGRLHRIRVLTLFHWGTADRIPSEGYGRTYCDAIARARFATIERARHYPHIEQPDAFARAVLAFIEGPSP